MCEEEARGLGLRGWWDRRIAETGGSSFPLRWRIRAFSVPV